MLALHETVAVPDPVRLAGLMAPQASPDGTVSVSETVPENLFSAVTLIVDAVDAPMLVAAGEVAAMLKSWNWKRAVAEWTREPLVPVKVSV